MKKLYFLGLISLWGITLAGQVTLNWQVTDEQNRPLVGVSVWKKGTYEGVATDENGRFSIAVNPGKDVLALSYLGFEGIDIKTHEGMKLDGSEIMFPTEYTLPEVYIVGLSISRTYNRNCCCWGFIKEEMLKKDSLSFTAPIIPKVTIFPNPTLNRVFLQQTLTIGQVDLYNLNGQKLQSFNFNDQLNASIDLGNLPSGTYFLRSSKGWTEKVILQRE